MTDLNPNPNMDSHRLCDVLDAAADVLDFVAENIEAGGALARADLAELPRQMMILTARACRNSAQEEGRRLETFCEALWDRGVVYQPTRDAKEGAA